MNEAARYRGRSGGKERDRFVLDRMSSEGPLPLHYQVRERIARAISLGDLVPGDLLPPEEELALQGGISRTTVRQALAALVQAGYIERRRGLGTRIVEPKISQQLSALTGFAEDMLSAGLEPLAKVVSIREIAANSTVTQQLRLQKGSKIIRVERVRLADGSPILFDVSHLPLSIGRRIALEDLEHRPIFSLLEDDYGITLGEADYRIQAVSAGRYIARLLDVAATAPLLMIERTTYATDGTPIDYETLHYRGDRMTYFIRLKRTPRPSSLRLATGHEPGAGG